MTQAARGEEQALASPPQTLTAGCISFPNLRNPGISPTCTSSAETFAPTVCTSHRSVWSSPSCTTQATRSKH
eukprot:CAMPEP_0172721184 /NCGR_PEP_ID=MMETSP1074-20121228/78508_1 /TAXON_ID=2916 /ORGANISM="Ceratium fusus, Strain PA161109" /LENGTH=71 /DNA_ID=CAMNT_0013546867 /DNA_START=41 /DNA_END=253 /DNA_ORIENTATION=-